LYVPSRGREWTSQKYAAFVTVNGVTRFAPPGLRIETFVEVIVDPLK
jgi:hypothetical protein